MWAELRAAFDLLPSQRTRSACRCGSSTTARRSSSRAGTRWQTIDHFFDAAPSLTELWWKPERAEVHAARRDARASTSLAGASFVQVNARVAAALQAHLLERVRRYEPRRVIDGYAGTGATTLPLAAEGRMVVAIEWDRDAVEQLRERLAPPSRAVAGRVEDHLAAALPADVVMLNPPRTGVDAKVTSALESASAADARCST